MSTGNFPPWTGPDLEHCLRLALPSYDNYAIWVYECGSARELNVQIHRLPDVGDATRTDMRADIFEPLDDIVLKIRLLTQ